MKIKGAYLLYYDPYQTNDGINKKILGQIKAMRNEGFEVDEVLQDLCLFGKSLKKGFWIGRILNRMPFISAQWVANIDFNNYDFIYMRRPPFMNGAFISKLKKIKKENPEIKIILEIPSYPYDFELWKRKIDWTLGIKEKIARKSLPLYIDKIAEISEYGKIFGIDTIQLNNGLDFDKLPIRNPVFDDTIDLMCVAVFQYWHGYERLIESIRRYYLNGQERKIKVHFVGDGPETVNYKQLIEKYGLQEHFVFYGRLDEDELQKIYDIADIGVCGLGAYKIGVFYTKELKSREYMAAGLPMVECCDLRLNNLELEKYMVKLPNSEVIFDIQIIIDFYDKLQIKTNEEAMIISQKIREAAKNLFDINVAYRPLIDYVKNNCEV